MEGNYHQSKIPHMYKGITVSTSEGLCRLNEIIYIRCVAQYQTYGKDSTDVSFGLNNP